LDQPAIDAQLKLAFQESTVAVCGALAGDGAWIILISLFSGHPG
jgi:hypothetical protein